MGLSFSPSERRARSSVGVIANALSSFRKADRHLPRRPNRRPAQPGHVVLRLLPAPGLAQFRRATGGRADWRVDRSVAVQLPEPHHRPGARYAEPELLPRACAGVDLDGRGRAGAEADIRRPARLAGAPDTQPRM